MKNYWPESATLPFGHIWSLAVEEHSYLFLAFLAFLVRTRRLPALVLLGLAVLCSVGATFLLAAVEPERTAAYDWRLRSETAAYGILVSAWLQVWFARRGGPPTLPGPVLAGMLGAGLLLHWWTVPYAVGNILGVGLLALVVNLLGSGTPGLCRARSHPMLRQAGIWSFSIYLWQQPLHQMVYHKEISAWVGLPPSLALGLVSFYLVEQPLRTYLNRRAAVSSVRAAVSTPSP